jgi:sugar lactone lactonase YvrE
MCLVFRLLNRSIKIVRWLAIVSGLVGLTFLSPTTQAKMRQPSPALSAHQIMPSARGLGIPQQAVGDLLPRIQCSDGYTAEIYAEGLSSPDGLAFNPTNGLLYVAEEKSTPNGKVRRIEANGSKTTVASNLANPEGIAFDDDGNLYVVEDVQNGRLLKIAPDSTQTTLASSLDAPEGVVWRSDGTIFFTVSNVQYSTPFNYTEQQQKITKIKIEKGEKEQ